VRTLAVLALVACAPPAGTATSTTWIADTSAYRSSVTVGTAPAAASIIDPYRDVAAKLIAAARADRGAYDKLAHLADRIGHRLSGSKALDDAIAWAAATMKADGHDARTEPVMVPHWVRGPEDASLVTPVARRLHIIGLGGTVPTPKGGLTAPVIVVRSFDELDSKAADVKGKIVLFDVAMPAWTETGGSGYGAVARYRTRGAGAAAKHGAIGMLVRSLTAHSLRSPHTGAMGYDPAQPKIPAAAVSVEDSLLIARLAAQGPVTVRLSLESKQLPDAKSANVIGELRGREKPDEIVVIGGHIDSWDVGQGANDDGAGCVVMMQALTMIRKLGLTPRRTIRVVLFTNEENGLRGAKAYAAEHTADHPKTVLAIEADSGSFAPRGFGVDAKPDNVPKVVARLAEIASLLESIRPMRVVSGGGGADIGPLVPYGVPAVSLDVDGRTYFDTHHTEADTLDKVDPVTLAESVAAIAVVAFIVADLPSRLDE
jgi:carboxypeptidase Q